MIESSIFDNMSDEEFEKLLIEHNIEFTRVPKGEGGLIYKGKRITTIEEWDEISKLPMS